MLSLNKESTVCSSFFSRVLLCKGWRALQLANPFHLGNTSKHPIEESNLGDTKWLSKFLFEGVVLYSESPESRCTLFYRYGSLPRSERIPTLRKERWKNQGIL
jgi:hypothetical protein